MTDVDEAIGLWQASFPAEWAADALDLEGVRRVVRLLLSGRRVPLRLLRLLGSSAEFWVAYEEGRLAGILGQLGAQIPRLTGLVLRGELRGRGVGERFLGTVLAEHDRLGTGLVSALPARQGWGRKALARLGFEDLGELLDYELPLPLAGRSQATSGVTWLRRAARPRTVRRAARADDWAKAVTLDATYGAPLISALGLGEGVASGSDGSLASVEYNAYQAWAQVRLCPPHASQDNVSLLEALGRELQRMGLRRVRVTLWQEDRRTREAVEARGGCVAGAWAWLVRPRPLT